MLLLSVVRARRHLHLSPTRRSSDLIGALIHAAERAVPGVEDRACHAVAGVLAQGRLERAHPAAVEILLGADADHCLRSEEHTSELQSLRHLVSRLLLEKKNKDSLIY